jgi:hypothetical protein
MGRWVRASVVVGLAFAVGLTACEGSGSEYAEEDTASAYDEARAETGDQPHISRDDALDRAASNQAGTTYADLGEPYGCTGDCSGHEAGVAWAEENDIRDPGDCDGRSDSFIEGCQAYAEAVQQQADEIERDGE